MDGHFGGLRRVLWVAIRRMPRAIGAHVRRLHDEAAERMTFDA